uniref:Mothers against decapentaplegic homolog n=1 Tax=Panagrolaimus sp. ES5 TaxID=591445 RepID=A0AC34F3H1_9BILA
MSMNIFSFNSSDPAVKSLLLWKVGGEEEKWALKAVESLVKKLRKKQGSNGSVEDLEFALANPLRQSKCVTIPRSMDGRLQVSHKKNLPHVIYCKLWRWPNVSSHHELRPVPTCRFPYDSRNENICINPYHYQRIEQQSGPIILRAPSASLQGIPDYPPRGSPMIGYLSPSGSGSESDYSQHAQMYSNQIGIQPIIQSQSFGSRDSPDDLHQHSPYSNYGYMATPRQPLAESPSALSDDNDEIDRKISLPSSVTSSAMFMRSTPPADENIWCTIYYYELNSRIGEPFKVSSTTVTVDGFTDPSDDPNRICLGRLSNVNRNHTTENTRRHIGRGVQFSCNDNNVTVTNFSQSTFFIQSGNANYKQNFQPTTVCRVPSMGSTILFDFDLFSNMLERAKCENDYQSVYELHKMCFIRMSFVKGWGQHYHRQEVTSTPCWIEMQLHRPLAAVDRVITHIKPPEAFSTNSK